jgi:hypothetical protein
VMLQTELNSLHGLERAADVIEEALQEHSAVRLGQVADRDRQADGFAKISLTPR